MLIDFCKEHYNDLNPQDIVDEVGFIGVKDAAQFLHWQKSRISSKKMAVTEEQVHYTLTHNHNPMHHNKFNSLNFHVIHKNL